MYSLRGDALEADLPWMRAEESEMDLNQINCRIEDLRSENECMRIVGGVCRWI